MEPSEVNKTGVLPKIHKQTKRGRKNKNKKKTNTNFCSFSRTHNILDWLSAFLWTRQS